MPALGCTKNTGPLESSFIISPTIGINQDRTNKITVIEIKRSKTRFKIKFLRDIKRDKSTISVTFSPKSLIALILSSANKLNAISFLSETLINRLNSTLDNN